MSKFARIIELEDGEQVLMVKGFDDEPDSFEIKITVEFEGFTASVNTGFDTEEKAINMLENFTDEEAEKFRSALIEKFRSALIEDLIE